MDTGRLRSIWRLIRSRNYIVVTVNKDGADALRKIDVDLENAVLMAVITRRAYEQLNDHITELAVDLGELRSLEQLRAAVEKLEVQHVG